MKKIVPLLVLFLLALLVWEAMLEPAGMSLVFDGEQIDGPFGALVALLFAGGGLVIGVLAIIVAALVVAVVFAGLGLLAVAGLVIAAVIVVAIVAPFLLPLLIPVAIIWYVLGRERRQRIEQTATHRVEHQAV